MEWLRGSIIKKNKKPLTKLHNGSGIITSLSKTNGIIEIDEEIEKIDKGNLLKFFRYQTC